MLSVCEVVDNDDPTYMGAERMFQVGIDRVGVKNQDVGRLRCQFLRAEELEATATERRDALKALCSHSESNARSMLHQRIGQRQAAHDMPATNRRAGIGEKRDLHVVLPPLLRFKGDSERSPPVLNTPF